MKKKYILLIVIGIILTTSLLIVLVSKNKSKKFVQDGVMFAVKVDGVPQDHFPNDGKKYYVDIECENARGQWKRMPDSNGNNDNFKISIDNITGDVECNVDFQSINLNDSEDEHLLSNIIKNGVNEDISPYNSTQYDYSDAYATPETSGIGNIEAWSLNANNEYESDPSLMTYGSRYYHLYTTISIQGSYRICYTIKSGTSTTSNRLYVFVNGTRVVNRQSSTSTEISSCTNLGYLVEGSDINISAYKYSGTFPVISLRLEKVNIAYEETGGYRYQGLNPNNYIWFNNDKWRIIGLIPTCTSSGCATSNNLVKIIKVDSSKRIAYDAHPYSSSSAVWGSNTLYSLLNSYYWGKLDGTNTSYCSNSAEQKPTSCDFTATGILPSDDYGSMVENVFWNTGNAASSTGNTAATFFESESQKQDVQGRVGFINSSDFIYASPNYSITSGHSEDNWMFMNKGIPTVSTRSDRQFIMVSGSNTVGYNNADSSVLVIPVVYLSPNVYVVGGNGTEATPYQIAKYSS